MRNFLSLLRGFASGRAFLIQAAASTRPVHPTWHSLKPVRCYSPGIPNHLVIYMPALTPTMTHGNLSRWLKKKGDKVQIGDIICEVETEKFLLELESDKEGYLAKILAPEGSTDIVVGRPIAVTVERQEDIENIPSSVSFGLYSRISPAAKLLIKQHGLDLNTLRASGPHGTLLKGDVLAVLRAMTSSTAGVTDETTDNLLKKFLKENFLISSHLKRNAEATEGLRAILKDFLNVPVAPPSGDLTEDLTKVAIAEIKRHYGDNHQAVLMAETLMNAMSNRSLRKLGSNLSSYASFTRVWFKMWTVQKKQKMKDALRVVWKSPAFGYAVQFSLFAFFIGSSYVYLQVAEYYGSF